MRPEPNQPRTKTAFTPRLSSVVWGMAFVVFCVLSCAIFVLGRDTLESTRSRAQEHLTTLQTLHAYRSMADLNFENSIAALDYLDQQAQKTQAQLTGAPDPVLLRHAQDLVARIQAFRDDPGSSTAASVEASLRRAEGVAEKRASESIRRQISASESWVWRFWGIWLVSVALIWTLSSVLVWWWVRPVRRLARRIETVQVSEVLGAAAEEALPSQAGWMIIPREVAALRTSVLSLLQRVSMAREDDFQSLAHQKHKAEVMAQALKESEQSKSHFLGLLSHEIRTPVTSLVMATRLLQRSIQAFENPVHRKLIDTSARDVERLRELLDDLLSISRFDADQLALVRRRTDMKRLLRNSQESFQGEANLRSVSLRTDLGDVGSDWSAEVDGPKLGWALSNLTLHSIRHTSKGGEVVVQMLRSQSATGSAFIEFRVRDTSAGIQQDRIQRAMDPFGGIYELRVARTEATGSALSIARSIAEAHGGTLILCSDPGRGCEYQMRIPENKSALN